MSHPSQPLEACASMPGLVNFPMSNGKIFSGVMHIQIFSSQEVEVGGSRNLGQPGLDSELKNSLVYMVRSGLKITRRRDVAQ